MLTDAFSGKTVNFLALKNNINVLLYPCGLYFNTINISRPPAERVKDLSEQIIIIFY